MATMETIDHVVVAAYLAGLLLLGFCFTTRIKNSADLFAAGNRSPWWLAGLSGFMTCFSAGSFVVWGGVAYRLGMVAVTIGMSLGVGALLVGFTLAGRWRRLGVGSAAEYLALRFGQRTVAVYTWISIAIRLFNVGIALYAIAVIMSALVPVESESFLRDSATGRLSVPWAIVLGGGVVVAYTVVGGLWAVMVTDALQFIILFLAILVVVPLCLMEVGGVSGLLDRCPSELLMPVGGSFTWGFIVVYGIVNYFRIGMEWAIVQRYVCVPTARDARRTAFLFGTLYLVTPLLLYSPAIIYRVINPNAEPEQAYILACGHVLPQGMLGLLLAAMFSATASMADSEINVFAGVLTRDMYGKARGIPDDDPRLIWIGRVFSMLLGALVILIALSVPWLGGAEKIVLAVTGSFAGPLLLPPFWGLISRRLSARGVWCAIALGLLAACLVKCGFSEAGWFVGITALDGVTSLFQSNLPLMEVVVGLVVPLLVLIGFEIFSVTNDRGWSRLERQYATYQDAAIGRPAIAPAVLVAAFLLVLAVAMAVMSFSGEAAASILRIFSLLLLLVAATIAAWIVLQARNRRRERNRN